MARGVKRLFVVGLAVDFIVGRSVQHALEAESNWTVALVAPAARALYSADAVFDAVSRAPNGRLLQDTRLEHSTSHAAAMRELCGGTCDVPSYLSDCPHASDRPCAEEPCEQQFCAPLPDRAWGECTECDCAQFGVCNGDGSCTYVCEWPTHGPGCEEGWELELVIACVVACAVLLVVAAGGAWAFRAVRRSRERLNALRIVGSKELPGVGFGGEGHEYHIFLSHVWSSGQDQVAVIRRRLAELLPTVRCSLDTSRRPPRGNSGPSLAPRHTLAPYAAGALLPRHRGPRRHLQAGGARGGVHLRPHLPVEGAASTPRARKSPHESPVSPR